MSTLRDLHQAIGGTARLPRDGADDAILLGPVAVDSRQAQPGGVYWGLPGEYHDGAEFADEAFQRGAAGAVVHRPVDKPADRWLLQVEDTQRALWQWAAWNRRQFRGTAIAVSGSAAKTTVRQMIHATLRTRFRGAAGVRADNQPFGLPLAMLDLEPQHDYALFEMSPRRLCDPTSPVTLCTPKIAVLTQVAEGHPGGLGGRKEIADAAEELLASLPPDGLAVLGDDPWLRRFAQVCKAPVRWVGQGPGCDLWASDVEWGRGTLSFRLDDCRFHVPVWGRHHLTAALMAIEVGRAMGLSAGDIARGLGTFESVPAHCQVIELRGATVICDMNRPTAPAARDALAFLRDFDVPGRRIVVCGDIETSGESPVTVHRELGNLAVAWASADLLFAFGDHAGDMVAAARAAGMPASRAVACRSPEEILPRIAQTLVPGDVVLFKGVRGVSLEKVADALRRFPRRRAA
ncbi:MAG: UDP-N-acetylmuramoyl-tripeptide--D-alanyl-D-alanine ligase [Thermoguttaceae bacterium]|jgi:UDP-N-acetylmuramoyl-tripeptide--D-alanyl-D-alanine ligase|nr:UDP-N-acetylmuramoyl-tripeptide--D-alanyl-D-alanine ligase [Thermoguttaceae bacterium]